MLFPLLTHSGHENWSHFYSAELRCLQKEKTLQGCAHSEHVSTCSGCMRPAQARSQQHAWVTGSARVGPPFKHCYSTSPHALWVSDCAQYQPAVSPEVPLILLRPSSISGVLCFPSPVPIELLLYQRCRSWLPRSGWAVWVCTWISFTDDSEISWAVPVHATQPLHRNRGSEGLTDSGCGAERPQQIHLGAHFTRPDKWPSSFLLVYFLILI